MAVDPLPPDFVFINISTDTQFYVPELFIILLHILTQHLPKFIAGNVGYITVLKIKY